MRTMIIRGAVRKVPTVSPGPVRAEILRFRLKNGSAQDDDTRGA